MDMCKKSSSYLEFCRLKHTKRIHNSIRCISSIHFSVTIEIMCQSKQSYMNVLILMSGKFWFEPLHYQESTILQQVNGRKSWVCRMRNRKMLCQFLFPMFKIYIFGMRIPDWASSTVIYIFDASDCDNNQTRHVPLIMSLSEI